MQKLFLPADVLLPKPCYEMSAFSVPACDQYTSQRDVWEEVRARSEGKVSAYRMVFPEAYLGDGETAFADRVASINRAMEEALSADAFDCYENSYIYVERRQRDGRIRRGLVGKIDLEGYDFPHSTGEDVQTPIRATEGTVLSRIPPRVKIREHAPLELPHVMLLADDPQKTCIEAIGQHTARMRRVYDFDLMLDSGRLTGWRVNESDYGRIDALIERLSDETAFAERYGISLESGKKPLVLAVGDGNHSLATARQCWDNVKSNLSEAEQENHPARYALVELCNLHDDALDFEPIHRVVFGVEAPRLMRRMKEVCGLTEDASASGQKLSVVLDGQERAAVMTVLSHTLPVGTLQTFLDDYIRECGGEIDYIHGAEVVKALTRRPDAIGFLLSGMAKSELYPTVVYDKTLPRKTFSMGEAWDKRFYCEARKLR